MPLKLEAPPVLDGSGPTRVLIVRHAESTFNARQRCQGRSDEPVLTTSGGAAAVLAGRYLAVGRIDAVISSPLRRALQTALIITRTIREVVHEEPSLDTSEDLMEIDLPQWQGLALEAVRQQFPNDYGIWSDRPHEFQMSANGGSLFFPLLELFGRVNRFWRTFLVRHAGKTVALVTHTGTARALISAAVGITPKRFHSLQQSSCGISILEFPAASTTAQIEALNLTGHLGEDMPKLKLGRRGVRIILVSSDAAWPYAGRISGMLPAVPLNFVWSASDPQSKELGRALIESHPDIQVDIVPDDDRLGWRNVVEMRLRGAITSDPSLITGLLVASNPTLSSLLSAVLGLEQNSFPCKRADIAVLHYPGAGVAPVIQALNMPVWKQSAQPVAAEACA
jgi:broad specificity phosphatase PhoE